MEFNEDTFAAVRSRLNRLMRLIELNAPEFIIAKEYEWFKLETERADAWLNGIEIPYTQEQEDELDEHYRMFGDFYEDEEESKPS